MGYYLINAMPNFGGINMFPGTHVTDTTMITNLQNAGAVLFVDTDATVAAAALVVQNLRYKGQNEDLCAQVMEAAAAQSGSASAATATTNAATAAASAATAITNAATASSAAAAAAATAATNAATIKVRNTDLNIAQSVTLTLEPSPVDHAATMGSATLKVVGLPASGESAVVQLKKNDVDISGAVITYGHTSAAGTAIVFPNMAGITVLATDVFSYSIVYTAGGTPALSGSAAEYSIILQMA